MVFQEKFDITDFLSFRKCRVVFNGKCSSRTSIKTGGKLKDKYLDL